MLRLGYVNQCHEERTTAAQGIVGPDAAGDSSGALGGGGRVRAAQCRRCGDALHGTDLQPHRHQVIEMPPPAPQVTEYQLHRLPCTRCGLTTCGTLPPGVPTVSYGPRLAKSNHTTF